MFLPCDKPEQPKLLPGRRPILQIAERPIQFKTKSEVSIPESSIIPKSLRHYDKVIPLSDYTISQCQNIIQFLEQ